MPRNSQKLIERRGKGAFARPMAQRTRPNHRAATSRWVGLSARRECRFACERSRSSRRIARPGRTGAGQQKATLLQPQPYGCELLAGLRKTVKEVDHSRIERILGA